MTPEEKEMQDIEEIQMHCSKNIRECVDKFGSHKTIFSIQKVLINLYRDAFLDELSKTELAPFVNELQQKLYKNSDCPTDTCEGKDDFKMSKPLRGAIFQ